MPRERSDQPAYRLHISGQARVTLGGVDYYLGEHNSPQSKAKYFALLGEYLANDKKAPEFLPQQLADAPITIKCVTAEYREHIKQKYPEKNSHRGNFDRLCNELDLHYGNLPADEFGPRKLKEMRDLFVAGGNNRRFANSQVRAVCRIFAYAVSMELIDVNVLVRLKTLEPLRQGQTTAKEPVQRTPVEMSHVAATAKFLSPVVKAMVRIQAATGMRPSEVCQMRPIDIDQTNMDTWIYRPENHKTAHRGKTKAVPIVGDARLALEPYMDREPDAYCFSPRESVAHRRKVDSEKRVTPANQGDSPGTNRKENPKLAPGTMYNKDSYRVAIRRAAKRAKVPHWFPYQLRYAAAHEVRDALGVEIAGALLGHSNVNMTQHYAKQTEAKAVEGARHLKGIGE